MREKSFIYPLVESHLGEMRMSYERDFVTSKYTWPWSLRYGEITEVSCDVLIVGGGIAGCWAAIKAAQRGAKVVIAEKGVTVKSGAGGMGCDHWAMVAKPIGKLTAEEIAGAPAFGNQLTAYICARDSYDTLMELEKMGGKIRDTLDEFKGAEFRDEDTKFLWAYDYVNKHTLRVWGLTFKPALHSECLRLGVKIYDRVMVTSMLTEGGKPGTRVVGATGINTRTGEFYIFKAKAVVLTTGGVERVFQFSSEYGGLNCFNPMYCTGDGLAMASKVGAVFADLEVCRPMIDAHCAGGFGYAMYATGNPHNTWYACSMVDADGKEIPWVDANGKILESVSDRYKPVPGQKYLKQPLVIDYPDIKEIVPKEYLPPGLLFAGKHVDTGVFAHFSKLNPYFMEAVKKGEIKLPLYADLPSMPEQERRVIFGLMIPQEGKCWVVYRNLTQAGFNPEKDLLQGYQGLISAPRDWLGTMFGFGGIVPDWDLKAFGIEGLYVAGSVGLGAGAHPGAAGTGRWAGAHAADYAAKAPEPTIDKQQVEAEMERVYAPVLRAQDGTGKYTWKEINAAISKVMREYRGEILCESVMKIGLIWLNELEESEVQEMYARNPHELVRCLEVLNILDVARLILHSSLARKASSKVLGFYRVDYPELDPPEWQKHVTVQIVNGEAKIGDLPFDYYLRSPNKPTLAENYEEHCPWR